MLTVTRYLWRLNLILASGLGMSGEMTKSVSPGCLACPPGQQLQHSWAGRPGTRPPGGKLPVCLHRAYISWGQACIGPLDKTPQSGKDIKSSSVSVFSKPS